DDIMKDVINRGTAAQAQGWGFRNLGGKTAFAGKTGTSRDGWFAGFTPELICVVYVGFDDGDDLGMKGSDSAMPVWADFMQEALKTHPEWNGDWTMPATIRKAEIDTRNGALIREMDGSEPIASKATPSPTPTATPSEIDPAWSTDEQTVESQIFVTDVPPEFRRVELFVAGTVPNKALLNTDEGDIEYDPETGEPIPPKPKAEVSPTPLTGTWEDKLEPGTNSNSSRGKPKGERARMISVVICPVSGMRATAACPISEAKSFPEGREPQDFCAFHR
ncbi:MAG TPA: hypothetical protein VK612_04505, partial [Pyrinomonadaceae bacterium]|nr:hypothetical protein [Pyrinomonadaceae bacterium]